MVISRKRQEIKIIMKARNAVMTLLTAGLMSGSCTSTVKVPEGKYLIRGTLENVADGTVGELLKAGRLRPCARTRWLTAGSCLATRSAARFHRS